jgi:hypothetical protein
MAALAALEPQALAVGCRDVTTPGAATAGVARIDQLKPNTRRCRLVGNKKLPLGVGPAVDFGSEVLPFFERGVSHVAQIFADDPLCSNLNRVTDQVFARCVQERIGYGCLIPGHPSQEPPRTLGANRLDNGAAAPDTRTTVIQFPAFEEKGFLIMGVGRSHQPLHAKVHAHDTTFRLWLRDLDLVREKQIPLPAYTFDLGVFPTRVRNPWADQFNQLPKNCDTFVVPREVTPVGDWHRRLFVDRQSPAIIGFGGFVVTSSNRCDIPKITATFRLSAYEGSNQKHPRFFSSRRTRKIFTQACRLVVWTVKKKLQGQ